MAVRLRSSQRFRNPPSFSCERADLSRIKGECGESQLDLAIELTATDKAFDSKVALSIEGFHGQLELSRRYAGNAGVASQALVEHRQGLSEREPIMTPHPSPDLSDESIARNADGDSEIRVTGLELRF